MVIALLSALLLFFIVCSLGAEVRINDAVGFSVFVNNVNNGLNCSGTTVFLESDLSLSGYTINPISISSSYQFRGVFDGQGYVISNLNINKSSQYVGLFGYSYELTIKNVVLDSSCSITSSFSGSNAYVGGIIGYCSGQCNIENNVNMANASFSGSNSRYSLYLGGIAGYVSSYSYKSTVKNCANYGSVTHSGTSFSSYIGGIVGILDNSYYKYIYNCLNHGTIIHSGTTSSTLNLGGIVGYAYYSYIKNCVSARMISSSNTASYTRVGSLVGYVSYDTHINYCYYTDKLSGYSVYGRGTHASISNALSYNSNTFKLNETVSLGYYSGNTLIDALNAASDYYMLRDYSHWLLNKNSITVSFTINDRTNPIKIDHQIILLPNLASEGNLLFNGWYTSNEYITPFTSYEVTTTTSLYGKFEQNTNYYTITFNTRREGSSVSPIQTQFGATVSLPNNSIKDYCVISYWENVHGDNFGFSFTMIAQDITLYAVWKCTHIETPDDFLDFSKVVNSGTSYLGTTVYLDSDLSLSGYALNPVGTSSTYQFRGTFDGQGYMISNLNITKSSQIMGLFGSSYGLTIRNVVLDSSCSITNTYIIFDQNILVGGIIGYCFSRYGQCNIENNVNMASVTFSGSISSSNYDLYLGGIVGNLQSSSSYVSTMKNCANYGSVTHSETSSYSDIGGIVGKSYGLSLYYNRIQNCINYGTVTHSGATSSYLYIGGIAGYASYTYIENCVSDGKVSNTGTLTGISYIGSVVGFARGNTYIIYCYYTSNVGVNNLYDGGNSPSSTTGTSPSSTNIDSTLVNSLNSQATIYGWNKWLLNSNNKTVTFKVNNNCGFSLSSQVVLLPDLASDTLVFSGWYTDSLLKSIFSSSSVLSDITLYGGWLVVSVTLNANGGGNVPASKNLIFNNTYGNLQTPSRTGYTFVGWFTETPEGDLVTNSTVVTLDYDHTLYAHWKPIQYTISFVSDGERACDNITQDYDTPITLPVLSKTGYTFICWCNDTDLEFEYTTKRIESRNATLYAKWEANNYTVSFKEECKVSRPPVNVTYDCEYNVSEPISELGFLWWEIVETGQKVNSESIIEVAHNHTLCAVWETNTITFNATGGDDDLEPVNATYCEKYENLTNATKTGYTFVGWFFNESSTESVTEDTDVTIPYPHTLYAHWRINSYTVTFNPDNGENAVVSTLEYNSAIVYPKDPEKRGYTFSGWDNGRLKLMPAEDVAIIAQWKANNYTVSFDVNGGDELVYDEVEVTFNSTYSVLPVPTRNGYSFAGWFNDENENITNETTVNKTDDHTLYAQWNVSNYIVTFDINGGDELANKEIEVTFNSEYRDLPTPNKTGHTFAGWTDSLFEGNEINSSTIVSIPNNHTLYALWDVNQYTMTFMFEGMEPINITLNYNDMVIYPNENPSKSFHRFRRWCTRGERGEEECNATHVPDHDLTFTAFFDVDSSLVAGTTVGAFAVVLFIILIIVIVFLIRVARTMKHNYEVVGIEMEEDTNERNDDIEERIRQQVEATSISIDIKKKLEKPLKKADKNKGAGEILMDLDVDCENAEDIGIIDSYRTTNASAAVANTINNEKNLNAATEYLTLLYTSVREQEEYEKFDELYFGMKDVDDFMNNMDEKTICFGGIVSGFTSKMVAIQSLISREEEEESNMPSGVLFRVCNGIGYRIGKVNEDTDEVLFELCSSFKIESMKEINRDKYIVVNLSFVSPLTKDVMVKI